MKDKFYVVDVETTGQEAKTAHIVEYAVVETDGISTVTVARDFVKPPGAIPPETSAIHQITDDDVKNAPSWSTCSEVLKLWVAQRSAGSEPVLVAHNAEYEKTLLGPLFPNIPWICTFKCALRAWPDAPSHSNEGLRYFLRLPNIGRAYDQRPHSAGHDALVTAKILRALLSLGLSVDALIEWTIEPAQLPTCPIGKHRGEKWSAIPSNYLDWIVNKAVDMRGDVKHCARTELQHRHKRS